MSEKKMLKVNIISFIYLLIFPIILIGQNLLNNPESVVYDATYNRYLVSNWGNGAIVEIDSNGIQRYFNTDYLNQFSIAGLYLNNDTLLAAAGNAPNAGILGFDINNGQNLFHIILPDVGLPNDIVVDSAKNIFVTDYWGSKLYKIRNDTPSVFINDLTNPNGMYYDADQNRLLILSVVLNAKILAVNLPDTSVSTVYTTTFNGMDGITRDEEGNYYISEWTSDAIHKFENSFAAPPQVYSTGHADPADIYFDHVNSILAVPNFSSNSVDFIEVNPNQIQDSFDPYPREIKLHANYPNPFNPSTNINFELPQTSDVTLIVYNLLGQKIKTLAEGNLNAGSHTISWNGTNDNNLQVTSGVYIYEFRAGNQSSDAGQFFIKTRKMILMR